jgi:hypothetical protein
MFLLKDNDRESYLLHFNRLKPKVLDMLHTT